jgi:hypothetical protein
MLLILPLFSSSCLSLLKGWGGRKGGAVIRAGEFLTYTFLISCYALYTCQACRADIVMVLQ